MPESNAQRRARLAAETPAQKEARRAKDRARYRAKRKQKPPSAIQILRRANAGAKPPEPPSPVVAMIDAALAATVPNVESLAHRDVYPDAVDELTALIGWQGGGPQSPAAILWTGDVDLIVSYRLAHGLGMFEPTRDQSVRRDRAWLRTLDSESARVALAMLGELPDWQSASPRERGGHLLGLLIQARRREVQS